MKKSTGSISLVLLGTALSLAGCSEPSGDEDEPEQAGVHGGYAGVHVMPRFRPGGGGRAGVATVAPSAPRSPGPTGPNRSGRAGVATVAPSARGGFGGIGSHPGS